MTCKDCIHSGLCYKENDYENFPDRCGDFISDKFENARPKGEWIADTNHCYDDDEDTFECSICKEPFTLICGTPKDNLYNFCPNCGADMRGEDNG